MTGDMFIVMGICAFFCAIIMLLKKLTVCYYIEDGRTVITGKATYVDVSQSRVLINGYNLSINVFDDTVVAPPVNSTVRAVIRSTWTFMSFPLHKDWSLESWSLISDG